MNIGFIGAGKVGSAFGHYLKDRKLNVLGYYSRSMVSAQEAASFTNTNCFNLKELVEKSNYIFITTPDDAISEIWSLLKNFNLQDKKIFHMSGVLSSDIFDDIEAHGACGYSLHPLFPFSDKNNYIHLDKAVFSLEGKKLEEIEGFLSMSGINFFEIKPENKVKYHAAAVFVSNYIVSLSKISENLLLECGIPQTEIGKALYPLMLGAINNIFEKGAEGALTGPIVRGDTGTIIKHREALGKYRRIYDELGEVALDIVSNNGKLPLNKLKELNNILGGNEYEKNS